jgi:hypothetical protein
VVPQLSSLIATELPVQGSHRLFVAVGRCPDPDNNLKIFPVGCIGWTMIVRTSVIEEAYVRPYVYPLATTIVATPDYEAQRSFMLGEETRRTLNFTLETTPRLLADGEKFSDVVHRFFDHSGSPAALLVPELPGVLPPIPQGFIGYNMGPTEAPFQVVSLVCATLDEKRGSSDFLQLRSEIIRYLKVRLHPLDHSTAKC